MSTARDRAPGGSAVRRGRGRGRRTAPTAGPPNGPRSSTTRVRPGTTPRSVEVRQRGAVPVLHPLDPELPADRRVGEPGAPALDVRVAGPRDRVAVRVVRAAGRAARRCGRAAGPDTACSRASASSCTSCGASPTTRTRKVSSSRCRRTTCRACPAPCGVSDGAVVACARRARARRAAGACGHGGWGDAQMAGQGGRAHLVAAARQHEDRAQRVFGRGGGHEPAAGP